MYFTIVILWYTVTDAYTRYQVVYKWKYKTDGPIETAKDMRLSQFDLIRTPYETLFIKNTSG